MTPKTKLKVFRDPVHGYINIPSDFCDALIDTPIFQRLRFIEQTGMRVLFPSAHHDRFSHSLGVYHLGQLSFDYLATNLSEVRGLKKNHIANFRRLRTTFLVACLMHDCAHAPFSHLCEDYYNEKAPGQLGGKAQTRLLEVIDDPKFSADLEECRAPAAHEFCSAFVLHEMYKRELVELTIDPCLVARMILGCTYRSAKDVETRLKNCLIQLLNSEAIDVDKLDYVLRDCWSSGVSSQGIDVHRLLSALTVSRDQLTEHRLAFKKSALSVMNAVIDGRNYLHRWIYSHHKVAYCQCIMQNAIKRLAVVVSPGSPDSFLNALFSLDAFQDPVSVPNSDLTFYLPTDGDVLWLLKKHMKGIPDAEEYFCRHHRTSLWKSLEEFEVLFDGFKPRDVGVIYDKAQKELVKDVASLGIKENDIVVFRPKPSLHSIEHNEVLIEVGGTCRSHKESSSSGIPKLLSSFFYVYTSPPFAEKYRNQIVTILRGYA